MSSAELVRHPRPEDTPLIRLLQAVDVCYSRIYHHVIVRTPCRLPKYGPAILICNHVSHLDPLVIQSVCPRLITWMMTHEFYDIKYLQWVFRTIGAIRVERKGRDMAAVRSALRALEEKRVLGIFPEGRIETSRDLLPFQTGAALIALKANVPIYPAYIDGTHRLKTMAEAYLHRNRISIVFGEPLRFDLNDTSREAMEAATRAMQDAIQSLKEESDRRNRRV